ncbi:MAG: hypothetical protein SYNGOMJ08_00727 [Candidatus Syntrophoarchaeum sp. GoM_oil]|nr:MAG: hypothetical protein SYNGOMJ08_00727 [Candidatus Syntrophoarchaeum sp. GoM_oil]
MELGKLQKIDLRKAWKHEALDFTNWLAKDENLGLLSDEIGIGLQVIQTEASVGKFNVDILAEEENTGRKVVIENQLEMTDHSHLGQVITYASGYDAEIIIWIVKDVRDEHKQAIDWLNEHTDEKINFFAIKMELWQIGNSPFAPKFQIISKPNDWAKAIKKSTGKSALTDTKLLQLEFWNKFKEYVQSNNSKLRLRKSYPQHWHDISFGSSDARISLTINSQSNQIACEIYIPNSKDLFYELEKQKDKIEQELDMKLEWMPLDGKKASRIKISSTADINDSDKWNEYFEWLENTASKFQKVFLKNVNKAKK